MIPKALLATGAGVLLAAFAGLLALVFRAAIMAPETPRLGGTYTEGMVGPVTAINPLFPGQNENAHDVGALLFEPLVRVESSGTVTPLLASRFEVSPDQRSYTFTIRQTARWSDGSPVTADDVVFTVRTVQDPQFPGSLLNASWKDIVATPLDSGRVRFTLPGRNAGFLATLQLLDIVPGHLLAGQPVAEIAAAAQPAQTVGSGPFRLVQRMTDRVLLERNPFSWRRPWLDKVVIRIFPDEAGALDALDRGQIDGVSNLDPGGVAHARRNSEIVVYRADTFQYTELLFNLRPDVPTFQDRRVRQAIAMAIDRAAIIRDSLGGQGAPADGPIPRSISWAYDRAAHRPGFDPQAAASLLTGAGWVQQKDGSRLKDGAVLGFDLVTSDLPPYVAVARQVAAELGAIGVEVTVRPLSTVALIHDALNPRVYSMALTAFDNGPDPDVFPFWHSSQAHPGGFNFSSMKRNVFIDRDLEDGRASLDLPTRARAYADLQELFAQEIPAVFLYSPSYSLAVDRRIHGVRVASAIEPDERFAYISDWYVEVGR